MILKIEHLWVQNIWTHHNKLREVLQEIQTKICIQKKIQTKKKLREGLFYHCNFALQYYI